jgi:hypothetical protein
MADNREKALATKIVEDSKAALDKALAEGDYASIVEAGDVLLGEDDPVATELYELISEKDDELDEDEDWIDDEDDNDDGLDDEDFDDDSWDDWDDDSDFEEAA